MDFTRFKALSFDVYGTLIDWETGIWNALQPLLSVGNRSICRNEALEAYGEVETMQEAETPSLHYRTLLAVVHARLARRWGISAHADLHERFGGSVPDWPAFPDSREALGYLKQHYRLVVLSNIDDESFAASNRTLGVTFDAVYTAENIGTYKPDSNNFNFLIQRLDQELGIQQDELLHLAQSLYHDHVPAEASGLATVWIDRRFGMEGSGATKRPHKLPKIGGHFPTLAEFSAAHRAASKSPKGGT
ncbi:haloacid dehalogenase type II [Mesorhizobium retamae]|uniref:Haloacid dehalogenase type II n=1 Tax=Mesorhizobium retamae TaxID=2912854 RepID=A0ABS9QJY6_9HYPH|nr:haloacid dehalogenase type II [Mesorhizobium sp. IRAMC:0171]MCG7507758.1 haloacid dehalogenase type II [Mesorhizobium sp. IRAMC:0171]